MMKLPRSFLIGLVVGAGLLLVVVAAAFSSVFQTWAVRRALQAQPGFTGEVSSISVGLNRVRVEHLRLQGDGYRLNVPSLEAELPTLPALNRNLSVRRVIAKGWTLDLTAPPRRYGAAPAARAKALAGLPLLFAAAAGSPTPASDNAVAGGFHGIFSLLDLPVDLSVASAELEGEIVFPVAPGQAPGRARVLLTGGGLGASSEARFTMVATVAVDDPAVLVNQLDTRSEIVARMDSPRSFARIEAAVVATASGPQAPNGARLSFDLSARQDGQGETYGFELRSAVRSLAGLKGALPVGGSSVAGSWALDMKETDLLPFALGRPLPVFSVAGRGVYEVDRTFSELRAEGALEATAERLEAVAAELASIGRVRVSADFDVAGRGTRLHVNRFAAAFEGDAPVARIEALQGWEWDRRTGELRVAEPGKDLLRVTLDGLPWGWLEPWVAGLVVQGEPLAGELLATARGGRFAVRTTTPLTAGSLTVLQDGRTLLAGVDAGLSGSAEYTPQGWQAELPAVSLSSGGRTLAHLRTLAGQALGRDQPVKATGELDLDLAALSAQPWAAGYPVLDAGVGRATFNLRLSHRHEVGVEFRVADLVAGGETLPVVAGEIRADVQPDGSFDLKAPVTVSRAERVSDLALVAAVKRQADRREVTAQVSSRVLHVRDLEVLGALAAAIPSPAPEAATEEKPVPAWEGVVGRVALDLKKVHYAPDATAHDVIGSIRLGPSALVVEDLGAALSEGGLFKLGGDVTFDPLHPERYALQADMTVRGFDPGPLLRALSPNEPPALEGKFDVVSRFSGRARELSELADATSGAMSLNSRGGTLRALSVDISEYARAGTRLASVAGLIGLATGDERVLKYSERLRAASELTTELSAVAFDQLTVQVERTAENHFVIKDLAVISPTVRLLGNGIIEHQPGVSVWAQPLSLRLQLGARDRLAGNLRTLKLLADQADALGYEPLVENLVLDGTLENIGTSRLRDLLVRALNGS